MDTPRLESLLEQLLDKQDEVSRIESLEATLERNVSDVSIGIFDPRFSVSSIEDELNWWGEKPTLAKQLLGALNGIESSVG